LDKLDNGDLIQIDPTGKTFTATASLTDQPSREQEPQFLFPDNLQERAGGKVVPIRRKG
jgi:hypothetical protein